MFENTGGDPHSSVQFGDIKSSEVGRKIHAFPSHFKKCNYQPCRVHIDVKTFFFILATFFTFFNVIFYFLVH